MIFNTRFIWYFMLLTTVLLFSNCNKEETDPESCIDGVQNQDEIGIDCGGICNNICPTCDDGIQNQGEPDIDCGGPCPLDCFFTPPCNFANNSAYLNLSFSNISCNPAGNEIIGTGLNGNITISFASFPTENDAITLGGAKSIKIDDFVAGELLSSVAGKMYVEYFGNTFQLTFCDVTFSSPSGNKVTSGKVTCL